MDGFESSSLIGMYYCFGFLFLFCLKFSQQIVDMLFFMNLKYIVSLSLASAFRHFYRFISFQLLAMYKYTLYILH